MIEKMERHMILVEMMARVLIPILISSSTVQVVLLAHQNALEDFKEGIAMRKSCASKYLALSISNVRRS